MYYLGTLPYLRTRIPCTSLVRLYQSPHQTTPAGAGPVREYQEEYEQEVRVPCTRPGPAWYVGMYCNFPEPGGNISVIF